MNDFHAKLAGQPKHRMAASGTKSGLMLGHEEAEHDNDGDDSIIVTPGEVITDAAGFLRGHGTVVRDGKLVATIAGTVQRVNKLVSVHPVSARSVMHNVTQET